MKFIHLTDTHFVTPSRRLYGIDPQARLEAAVADINTNHSDAAFAVVTGDLTHWGEPEAYAALKEVLGALTMPLHLLVGNHDKRDAFCAAFPETPVDEHGFVQYAIETEVGDFLALDTLEHGTHAGVYCGDRVAWLKARLAERAGRPVYLLQHHPPFSIGIVALDAIGLADRTGLGAALDTHDDIRHIFFGHVHRPVHGAWRGIPFTTQRATVHQTAFALGQGKSIQACLEPPAYAVVLMQDDAVIVHVHDYLDDGPRFLLHDERARDAESPDALRQLKPISG